MLARTNVISSANIPHRDRLLFERSAYLSLHLEHWRDTGPASYHTDTLAHAFPIAHRAGRAPKLDIVSNLAVDEISASKLAVGIASNDQLQPAQIRIV